MLYAKHHIIRCSVFSAGEGPCLATYFVRRYWQLLLLRVMTGISVGGTFPLVFSLIGDLFSVKQRANVAAGVQVATGVGFAAGQAIAGFVGVPKLDCLVLLSWIGPQKAGILLAANISTCL